MFSNFRFRVRLLSNRPIRFLPWPVLTALFVVAVALTSYPWHLYLGSKLGVGTSLGGDPVLRIMDALVTLTGIVLLFKTYEEMFYKWYFGRTVTKGIMLVVQDAERYQ